ncbi:hypothetical protein ACLNGM_17495 [Aureimonas phyllosphaerae]|uniref:hypothetical protein n=1 Tax=Aureimonas phyllosphaerae TaxID=1166078 RepID=UPI003A5BB4CB
MKNHLSSAAFAAALLIPCVCAAAELPFSAPEAAASEVFEGTVPAIAGLSLGTSYEDVERTFAAAVGDEFQLKRGNRELQFGNSRDGTVEFSFPDTLQLAGKADGAGPIREERTATFSSPLTGSQLLTLERSIVGRGGEELSIPAIQEAIVAALGQPTGRYDETTPKWSYVWLDGRLIAGADVPHLKATVLATMEATGVRPSELGDLERRVDACSSLAGYVSNDPLIDTVNALASGEKVPRDCTALATVVFYPGSQDDLSSRIVVELAYTGAIVQDAEAVGAHMREALTSGAGRKGGVGLDTF